MLLSYAYFVWFFFLFLHSIWMVAQSSTAKTIKSNIDKTNKKTPLTLKTIELKLNVFAKVFSHWRSCCCFFIIHFVCVVFSSLPYGYYTVFFIKPKRSNGIIIIIIFISSLLDLPRQTHTNKHIVCVLFFM